MTTYERIQPSVFAGPATWHALKCYVAKYEPTEQNKRRFKEWIRLTLELFPCEICSEHALANFRKHNIDHYLQNKDRLYLYVSMILQDGANDHKHIPISERPNYYDSKRFIFESLNGECTSCNH